ncbi:CbtB-domain containing protein [Hoyosella rhizosphaerae]|uniref:CbtB-domain containing protein n=1 Tax=Hoyosella rhizosphaerae TaxID=1755582 RepID=A0A916U9V6_9ACTN|nr:CbtB domain-containing protein [Hoyosella rhizosphaerae]MBN4927435.1 CbtB-domain containing protein [Hoyosella rhizosphaerae]GGC64411.1 hypothetical protein GCM10011410_16200 [Hoyosella rhizosphaerae]
MSQTHAVEQSSVSAAGLLLTIAIVSAAILVLYIVGFDQGAISRTGMFMHELMHDGRHLMGVPCH